MVPWTCLPAFLAALIGDFHVAGVVHRVEDPEDVHAVLRGQLDELLDHVVGVVPVAYQVLAPEEHLDGRLLRRALDLPQPFPRVLVQIADASVEGGPAPGF